MQLLCFVKWLSQRKVRIYFRNRLWWNLILIKLDGNVSGAGHGYSIFNQNAHSVEGKQTPLSDF